MVLIIVEAITLLVAVLFLILWLREKRHAEHAEIVAYGLRSVDESDENTKTNISELESGYNEAISRLEQLGEIKQDQWGNWTWTQTGKPLGEE